MSDARLSAGVLVSALLRRIEAKGGNGMVLAKGDVTSGSILILLADRGVSRGLLERVLEVEGYRWSDSGPADLEARERYLVDRRRTDPDLWIVELDHPDARNLALEMLG